MPTPDAQFSERNQFVWYVKQFLLTPYSWAGDDPMGGVDCSGLVVEGFKSIGWFYENEDKSADGFYVHFSDQIIQKSAIKPGCLAVWIDKTGDRAGQATHIAIFINRQQIIHSSGGGSSTDTLPEAIQKNAYMKIRLFEKEVLWRQARQTYKLIDPFKKKEEEANG